MTCTPVRVVSNRFHAVRFLKQAIAKYWRICKPAGRCQFPPIGSRGAPPKDYASSRFRHSSRSFQVDPMTETHNRNPRKFPMTIWKRQYSRSQKGCRPATLCAHHCCMQGRNECHSQCSTDLNNTIHIPDSRFASTENPGVMLSLLSHGIHVKAQPPLLEVRCALDALRLLFCRRQGRQQHGRQNGNDGDDHQQLNQSETRSKPGHFFGRFRL